MTLRRCPGGASVTSSQHLNLTREESSQQSALVRAQLQRSLYTELHRYRRQWRLTSFRCGSSGVVVVLHSFEAPLVTRTTPRESSFTQPHLLDVPYIPPNELQVRSRRCCHCARMPDASKTSARLTEVSRKVSTPPSRAALDVHARLNLRHTTPSSLLLT